MNVNALPNLRRGLVPAALAILLASSPAGAQGPALPAGTQGPALPSGSEGPALPIHPEEAVVALTRILDMDQNLTLRSDDQFMVIAVPYEKGQEEMLEGLMRICRYVARTRYFRQRGLRYTPVPLKPAGTAAAFRESLQKEKASAVLVPAGLSRASLDAVSQVSNEEKLHTLAMDPTQVERWFTVAVEPAPGKMQVVINADNVRNAGGWFDVNLLKVSRIVNADPNRKKKAQQPQKP